jgi:hypothetical protein
MARVPEIGSVWVDPEGDLLEVTDIQVHYTLNGTPAAAFLETWNNESIDDVDALHPFKHVLLPDEWLCQMTGDRLWTIWHPRLGSIQVGGEMADAIDYAWARDKELGKATT